MAALRHVGAHCPSSLARHRLGEGACGRPRWARADSPLVDLTDGLGFLLITHSGVLVKIPPMVEPLINGVVQHIKNGDEKAVEYTLITVLKGVSYGLLVGGLGALVERFGLRAVHRHGHVAELLFTFGLAYIIIEVVQLIWGRLTVPYAIPAEMDRPLFTLYTTTFPMYRAFMMVVALLMLGAIYLLLTRTRMGLVIQAALTHPDSVEALGHNVPRVFMLVFGGGAALAGLAGVIGGNAFVTEPAMAATVGSIIFVVIIIGGLGS